MRTRKKSRRPKPLFALVLPLGLVFGGVASAHTPCQELLLGNSNFDSNRTRSVEHDLPRFSKGVVRRKNARLPLTPRQTLVDIREMYGFGESLAWALDDLTSFFEGLRKNQYSAYTKSLAMRIKSDVRLLLSPSHSMHAVFPAGTSLRTKLLSLLRLYGVILDRSIPLAARVKTLGDFVRSEVSARYVYELLLAGAYPNDRKLMVAFYKSNTFFKAAISIQNDSAILITSSFEKEIATTGVVSYYRPKEMTDPDWFALPKSKRMEELAERTGQREYISEQIEKTSSAPGFLGSLGREVDSDQKNAVYEFRKEAYALSPATTKSQIGILIKDLKETDGFHFHVSFEIENEATEVRQFKAWKRDLNEQVLYAGLEEGLFPNHLTGERSGSDASAWFAGGRVDYWDEHKLPGFDRATSVGDDKLSSTVASRTTIYGDAIQEGYQRIGLEFRDVTRNPRKLDRYLEVAHQSIHQAVWRKIDAEVPLAPLKIPDFKVTLGLLKDLGFFGLEAERVIKAEPLVALPFSDFANHTVRDWKTGATVSLSDAAKRVFADRLQRFSAELKLLAKEMQSGTETDEEIQMAIRWSLREWAEATRISQVYSAF